MIKNTMKSNEEDTKKKTSKSKKKSDEAKAASETAEPKKASADSAPALKKELEELKDKHLRLMAEYDNFKKRTVKEKEAIYIDSVGDTVNTLLPVIDNFERAMAAFSEEDKSTEFYKGIEMIFNQMTESFDKLGVKQIEAVGCEFNPELHNAVMHVEDDQAGDNTIVEEFQKGYTYRDKVIRYSMVKVAN